MLKNYTVMDNADMMEQVCGYQRMIERTRLLKNTIEKLQQLVGFSVGSSNGLARKGGKSLFMKDAIFRELAHIVSADSDLVPPWSSSKSNIQGSESRSISRRQTLVVI